MNLEFTSEIFRRSAARLFLFPQLTIYSPMFINLITNFHEKHTLERSWKFFFFVVLVNLCAKKRNNYVESFCWNNDIRESRFPATLNFDADYDTMLLHNDVAMYLRQRIKCRENFTKADFFPFKFKFVVSLADHTKIPRPPMIDLISILFRQLHTTDFSLSIPSRVTRFLEFVAEKPEAFNTIEYSPCFLTEN